MSSEMLQRAEFCLLAGIHPEKLKSLNRRDELPFSIIADHPAIDLEYRKGWRKYKSFDALLMRIFLQVTENNDVSTAEATYFVGNTSWHLRDEIELGSPRLYAKRLDKQMWAASFLWWEASDYENRFKGHWAGTQEEILLKIEERRQNDRNYGGDTRIGRIIMSNASEAFQEICKIATENNIQFSLDDA